MELDVPIAIHGQMLTFPEAEKKAMLAQLEELAAHPERPVLDVRKSRSDPGLWTVRLTERVRALLRAEGNRLRVLAVASPEQLRPYLESNGKRVA